MHINYMYVHMLIQTFRSVGSVYVKYILYRVVQKKPNRNYLRWFTPKHNLFRFHIYPLVLVSSRDLINDINNINECIMTSLNIVAIATICFPISLICKSMI